MKDWFSPLFFLFAQSNEEQLRRQLEWKQAEIEMHRKRIPQQRIFLDDEERERLLKLGDAIGSDVTKLISIVSPRTYKRWRARKCQGEKPAKKMGTKGTPETLRQIVVRIAKETGWGYGRIVGELKKLHIQCVGRTTVRKILKEEGVHAAPRSVPAPSGDAPPKPCVDAARGSEVSLRGFLQDLHVERLLGHHLLQPGVLLSRAHSCLAISGAMPPYF